MSRRHRIVATLTTLAAATALSLAATGTASADSDFDDAEMFDTDTGVLFEDAAFGEDTQEDVAEGAGDLYGLYQVDWNAVEDEQEDAAEEVQEDIAEETEGFFGTYQVDW